MKHIRNHKNRWFRQLITLFALCSISLLMISCIASNDQATQNLSAAGFTTEDLLFKEPYIDQDEWRNEPVPHRYVHGGFTNTDTRFSFYFPSQKQYEGRFFQYVTPVPDSENLSQGQSGESDKIGFAIDSGAYFVETNSGGNTTSLTGRRDPTIGAFRANAAAAQFSRHIARQLYDNERPYGYVFGGSGGAYRTIASMENTQNVWDGAVPFVIGSPMSLPNVFTVRTYAMRVLGDKLPMIADRLDVGSKQSPYADLTTEQQKVLLEATRMGFPPAGWQLHEHLGLHAFAVIYPIVAMIDPGYFDDFWNKPGYEGYDGSPSLKESLINTESSIASVLTAEEARAKGIGARIAGTPKGRADDAWKTAQGQQAANLPGALRLKSTFKSSILGADLTITSGEAKGETLIITSLRDGYIVLDDASSKAIAKLKAGDTVTIDNSRFLAVQTYHRHQVPGPEFTVWDQFRNDKGEPIYPQRRILGPMLARGATGTAQTGQFNGKMIVVENLHDTEAFPWQGDWYRQQVKKHLGSKTDQHFRIWMIDHANHGDFTKQKDPTHTVSYIGVLQQALRDVSVWVEQGVAPPESTQYDVKDGQVIVAETAESRHGIQPVVQLTANGQTRADVAPEETVTLSAVVTVPPEAGEIVEAAWDLDGSGTFAEKVEFLSPPSNNGNKQRVKLEKTVHFKQAGTYFPVLRVASQRTGNASTPFARIQNLGRVRVVVTKD